MENFASEIIEQKRRRGKRERKKKQRKKKEEEEEKATTEGEVAKSHPSSRLSLPLKGIWMEFESSTLEIHWKYEAFENFLEISSRARRERVKSKGNDDGGGEGGYKIKEDLRRLEANHLSDQI